MVGYITRGRGVSIHRADCPNLLHMSTEPGRRVGIDWQAGDDEDFIVRLQITGEDRKGMLADLTAAITDTGTNIQSAELKSSNFEFTGTFVVEVRDLKHLNRIITALKKISGVEKVTRMESFSPRAIEKSG